MPSSKTCTFVRRSLMAVFAAGVLVSATWALSPGREVIRASEASPRRGLLTGTIAAPDAVPVISPVGGAVVTVAVDEGTTVRAGEVLAVLAHDETKLLAPVSGVISKRSVHRGSVVRPDGAAPFLIVPEAPLRVVVVVDEAMSRSLRGTSVASFSADASTKQAFKARFSSVRPEAAAPGTLPARYLASFTIEGEFKLAPGATVDVSIKR
ncbi:MAG: HlyD family efflux transporter periplasmic adaptor subunit [Myxococcales bacterium]|nr:HlyD family efflux transporter periplasmic adaptor subunit [Myxococcales bacterium]HRC57407.1 HlyD family efflux transporter periplasmic adaptor subunit [Kofleriaceae bacterium]